MVTTEYPAKPSLTLKGPSGFLLAHVQASRLLEVQAESNTTVFKISVAEANISTPESGY